jgi:hypothetical protein
LRVEAREVVFLEEGREAGWDHGAITCYLLVRPSWLGMLTSIA